MALREKLMHYTHDLDCGVDLKQEAIATIEHIAQYMDEDELLHHSRPLALAYLALTEDASVPVVHSAPTVDAIPVENCKVYGGYVSSVEDVAEAKRLLAKQAARCVERAMLDNDLFLVDGGTVSWKLLLYGGEGGT
nr:MAG TPA_asm: hypothetical protein [Caudoviricetes sp.]